MYVALRFYYATLAVLRVREVAAAHPLCTTLDQFRMLVIDEPELTDTGDWEESVCSEKERLGAMLIDAGRAGAVQTLFSGRGVRGQGTAGLMSEVVPNLWIGSARDAEDVPRLLELGVTHVCTCGDSGQAQPPSLAGDDSVRHVQIPVINSESANIARYFWKTNAFIHQGMDRGTGVLICSNTDSSHDDEGGDDAAASASSASCVVVAFLMQSARSSYTAALAAVRSARPTANPNAGFVSHHLPVCWRWAGGELTTA
jgi:hypothetical protein